MSSWLNKSLITFPNASLTNGNALAQHNGIGGYPRLALTFYPEFMPT
jgi:hypothetical protein